MNPRAWLPPAVTALGTATPVALGVTWWSRLPESVAIHWGGSGRADGQGPRWLLVLLPVVVVGGITAVAAFGGRHGLRTIWQTGVGPALATIMLGTGILTLRANLDIDTWHDAGTVPAALILALIAAGALVGAAVQRVVRSADAGTDADPDAPAPAVSAPSARLTAGERGAFIGTTRARWALWLLLPLGALAVLTAARGAIAPAIGLGTCALAVGALASATVRADARGLRVAFGPVGVPRLSIPLADIVNARSIPDLEPMEWGGWGYRGSLAAMGRAAVVLRRGEALVLDLTRDRSFAVTVDDADQAAGLLNDLRLRSPHLPPGAPIAPT